MGNFQTLCVKFGFFFSPTQGNILRYDRGSPALSNVQLGKAVVELVTDHQSVGFDVKNDDDDEYPPVFYYRGTLFENYSKCLILQH